MKLTKFFWPCVLD